MFAALRAAAQPHRIGLLIRAGVENGEMVEALGYRIRRLFVGVFVAGSALAGLGGAMWGLYQETVTAAIGAQVIVLVFIVIIIGGLGSVGGCFVGALLVGLTANYVGFLAPKVALGSNILLMALVLLWRPQGLYPVARGDAMLRALLSDDLPRSRWLAVALVALLVGLASRAVPVPRRQVAERRRQDLRLHRARGELRPAAGLHRHRLLRAHDVLRHRRLRRGDRAHPHGAGMGRRRGRRRGRASRSPSRWPC